MEIFVPRGSVDPVGECYLCGALFAPGDDVIRHMKACVPAAGHDAQAERRERVDRLEIFLDREAWNPDVEDHLRAVGRRMIAEGRLEMRPSERIRNE